MRVLLATAASAVFAILSGAALADDKSDCQNNQDRELQIKACSSILQRDAKDAIAYYKRGVAYQFKGDLDRAIADYNKAIEHRPSYAHAYESRGSAYASKGVYTNAVADVTKATELARKKAPGPKTGAPKPPTKIAAKPAGAIKKTVENEAPDTWPTWAPFGAGKP
jgi:tetratricopeptide (TPR) repeat protein